MSRLVILINSTPKYYYLLPLHLTLLERYGGKDSCGRRPTVVLATECPDHPICQGLKKEHDVELLTLAVEQSGFLDSRAAALRALLNSGRFDYVLPLQEDFLLDRTPSWIFIEDAMRIIRDKNRRIASMRLMPCPGPRAVPSLNGMHWLELDPKLDAYGFTFQATLWRLDACTAWYEALCERLERVAPRATTVPRERIEIEVRGNFAENPDGQRFFWEFFAAREEKHLAWRRAGPWANAVYLCPWPYRPTAIVKGRLEDWAAELAKREGVPLDRES